MLTTIFKFLFLIFYFKTHNSYKTISMSFDTMKQSFYWCPSLWGGTILLDANHLWLRVNFLLGLLKFIFRTHFRITNWDSLSLDWHEVKYLLTGCQRLPKAPHSAKKIVVKLHYKLHYILVNNWDSSFEIWDSRVKKETTPFHSIVCMIWQTFL